MKELQYNEPMTVGRLKESLKGIPDHVHVNVLNSDGKATANIFVWFEDLQTRQIVELQGYKPYYEMTEEEKKKCGFA